MAQLLCIQRCCLSLCSKLTEILLSNWLSFVYVVNCVPVKCGNRFGAKTMNGIFCGKGDMIICSLLWLRAPKFFVKLSEKETDSVPKRARSFLHKRYFGARVAVHLSHHHFFEMSKCPSFNWLSFKNALLFWKILFNKFFFISYKLWFRMIANFLKSYIT